MPKKKVTSIEPQQRDVKIPIDPRGFEVRAIASRAAAKDDRIEGYAALFNQYSVDLGGFIEIIDPGFFDDALENDDMRALWQHDDRYVLGRVKNETLSVEQDETGLRFTALPPVKAPDVASWALDAMVSLRRGDVDQMSFTFSVKPGGDEWYILGDKIVRRLKPGGCEKLWEVSPVTFPAYAQTSVAARSITIGAAPVIAEARDKETDDQPEQVEAEIASAQSAAPRNDDPVDDTSNGLAQLAHSRRLLEIAEIS